MACFYNFFPVCNRMFPITYPHIVGEFAFYERVRKKAAVAKIWLSKNDFPLLRIPVMAFMRGPLFSLSIPLDNDFFET